MAQYKGNNEMEPFLYWNILELDQGDGRRGEKTYRRDNIFRYWLRLFQNWQYTSSHRFMKAYKFQEGYTQRNLQVLMYRIKEKLLKPYDKIL